MTGALFSSRQGDLLEAALGDDDGATAAWQRWRDAVDWDAHLDRAEFRLLPRLHANLCRLGVEDPLLPRLRGVARQAFAAGRLRLRALEPTITALAADGVDLLVLPPSALLLLDGTAIADPTEPFACGVRAAAVERTLARLRRLGWRPRSLAIPAWCLAGYARAVERLEWTRDDGLALDLVWQRDGADPGGRLPTSLWRRSRQIPLGGATLLVPEPGDAIADVLRAPPPVDALEAAVEILLLATAASAPGTGERDRRLPAVPEWGPLLDAVRERLPGRVPTVAPTAGPPSALAAFPRGPLRARLGRHWSRYRGAATAPESLACALGHLPGYLLGCWNLPSLAPLPRRFWRGFVAECRSLDGR